MGSMGAMIAGSSDRYGQAGVHDRGKLVPEGVEGRVPYRGPLGDFVYQLVGGLRAGMGYCGTQEHRSPAQERPLLPRLRRQHGREPPARHRDHQGVAELQCGFRGRDEMIGTVGSRQRAVGRGGSAGRGPRSSSAGSLVSCRIARALRSLVPFSAYCQTPTAGEVGSRQKAVGRRPTRASCAPSLASSGLARALRSLLAVSAYCLLPTAYLACSDSSGPEPGYDRTEKALKDPMHYTPGIGKSDVSGGDTGSFDKDGLRKDLDHVFNP